jgi:hypothetical protein
MDLGNQSEKYKLAKCIRLNFKQNSHLLILSLGCILYFSQCNTSKHLNDGQYLLTKNIIVENGKKIRKHQVHELVKQKTNKKTWGFLPLYLQIYNLASNKKKNHYLKRIGEAPWA